MNLFAFVTSVTTQGDMQGLPGVGCVASGIGRADCACDNFARQNNLRMSANSRFIAWLSTSLSEMRCRIVGIEGTGCTPTGSFVWYNTNYDPVFTSLTGATNGVLGTTLALTYSLKYTETGSPVPSEADNVWTGTDVGGLLLTNRCQEWSSSSNVFVARTGQSDLLGNAWTNSADKSCDGFRRIYCFAVP